MCQSALDLQRGKDHKNTIYDNFVADIKVNWEAATGGVIGKKVFLEIS